MKKITQIFALLFIVFAALAQKESKNMKVLPPIDPPLPPPITIRPIKPVDKDIEIADFKVDSSIYANIAQTSLSISFYNPNNRNVSADFIFPIPSQSTLTAYALDIEGVMVDGVAVEKHKARVTFEKIVRQGIDPGLVEKVTGNVFKTRIFPITAKGKRTIRIDFVTILTKNNQAYSYQIPLMQSQLVKDFKLKIQAYNTDAKPIITDSQFGDLDFSKWRNTFVTEFNRKDFTLQKPISIEIPKLSKNTLTVAKNNTNDVFFAINPNINKRLDKHLVSFEDAKYKTIQLVWDASHSRRNANHDLEIDLLSNFFNKHQSVDVELFFLRNTLSKPKAFTITHGNWGKLKQALKSVNYDGATNLTELGELNHKSDSEVILLFTDAIHTFLPSVKFDLPLPLYIFNSSLAANQAFAQALAQKHHGQAFTLSTQSDFNKLTKQIGRQVPQFISITVKNGRLRHLPNLPREINVLNQQPITGQLMSNSATLVLNYGYSGNISEQIEVEITQDHVLTTNVLELVSVQQRLYDLQKDKKTNRNRILDIAQKYNLASDFTSLLVLENLDQYLENKIAPPQSLAKMRAEYFAQITKKNKQNDTRVEDKIKLVIAMWETRKSWWEKDFPKVAPIRKPSKNKDQRMRRIATHSESDAGENEQERVQVTGSHMNAVVMEESVADEVMVAEAAPQMKVEAKEDNTNASVQISEWNPDTPYLKELAKTNKADRSDVYYRLKKDYLNSPAYYFDCANFFFTHEQKDFAVQVLSNIAELKIQDSRLLRTMAMAMRKHNYFEISIWAYNKVLNDRSEEPQSYRDLALTLIQRVDNNQSKDIKQDYAKAIELLYKVVTEKWARFNGIEVTVLMEINALIPQLQKYKIDYGFISKQLINLLDVDLRITLSWDSDMTDIDLWVIEPSGEKVTYSKTLSSVGGMFHKDFTGGYGPEEYLLHHAPKGEYTIKVHFYGNNSPELTGATTLYVDVYTNYGRKNKQKQTLSLRLENQDDDYLVGKITID